MRPDAQTRAMLVAAAVAMGLRKATLAEPVRCQYSASPTTKSRMVSWGGRVMTVVCRMRVESSKTVWSGVSSRKSMCSTWASSPTGGEREEEERGEK